MRTLVFVALLSAGSALAQVQVNLQLPTVTFSVPPPLVVVEPGVQVVEDHDDEVFFVDGWYWVRRDERWFRTRDYKGGWSVVATPAVPVTLVRVQPGKYRRWKRGGGAAVVVNPPGPGKVKLKVKKGKHGRGHDHDD